MKSLIKLLVADAKYNYKLDVDNDKIANNMYSEVIKAYSDNRRFYHNMEHVNFMLTNLDVVLDDESESIHEIDVNALKLAIFMHDYFISYTEPESEIKSILGMFKLLKIANTLEEAQTILLNIMFKPWDELCLTNRVACLIFSTKFNPFNKRNMNRFQSAIINLDYLIFNKDLDTIIEYENNIKREVFAYLPDLTLLDYKTNRIKFLESLFWMKKEQWNNIKYIIKLIKEYKK